MISPLNSLVNLSNRSSYGNRIFFLYLRNLHRAFLVFPIFLSFPWRPLPWPVFYLIIKLDFFVVLVSFSFHTLFCTLASLNISTQFFLVIFVLLPKEKHQKAREKFCSAEENILLENCLPIFFLLWQLFAIFLWFFYALNFLRCCCRANEVALFCHLTQSAVCCLLQLFNCLASVITFDMAMAGCGCCFCLLTVAAFCLSRLLSGLFPFPLSHILPLCIRTLICASPAFCLLIVMMKCNQCRSF